MYLTAAAKGLRPDVLMRLGIITGSGKNMLKSPKATHYFPRTPVALRAWHDEICRGLKTPEGAYALCHTIFGSSGICHLLSKRQFPGKQAAKRTHEDEDEDEDEDMVGEFTPIDDDGPVAGPSRTKRRRTVY